MTSALSSHHPPAVFSVQISFWRHETCVKEGLRIAGVEALSVKNVIVLLDGGNDYQDFRYFTLESQSVPDLDWTSRVVGALVKEIKEIIVGADPDKGKPSLPVKIKMIIGEPQPKK